MSKIKNILVCGGAGYIGSHATIQLLEAGYGVVVLDNLTNSSTEVMNRIEHITGSKINFVKGDICSSKDLSYVFDQFKINAVMHFAGLKSVSESTVRPLEYYKNNIGGTLQLLQSMKDVGIKKLIFSSSATIYGEPLELPLREVSPKNVPTNPYAFTKVAIERILEDVVRSDADWSVINLRYFNPLGAHPSGLIGEEPSGIPNNLMPYISQTAIGKYDHLKIFGNDYDTPDGTGVRDYIHVEDLVAGHLKALRLVLNKTGIWSVNLGTGIGYSVYDLLNTFQEISGTDIRSEVVAPRLGDVASCYADNSYAKKLLGWSANKGLKEMCEDTWRWQLSNPNGYRDKVGESGT